MEEFGTVAKLSSDVKPKFSMEPSPTVKSIATNINKHCPGKCRGEGNVVPTLLFGVEGNTPSAGKTYVPKEKVSSAL